MEESECRSRWPELQGKVNDTKIKSSATHSNVQQPRPSCCSPSDRWSISCEFHWALSGCESSRFQERRQSGGREKKVEIQQHNEFIVSPQLERYGAMIIEALTALKKPDGSEVEIGAIHSFIEQRHEVPANFRRLLSTKVRRLVQQNRIEKGAKGYRLKGLSSPSPSPSPSTFVNKTPTPEQNNLIKRSRLPQSSSGFHSSCNPREVTADIIAYYIADAEAKSFLAAEAIKNAERFERLAEEAEAMVKFAEEVVEKCECGEVVTLGYAENVGA